MAEQQKRHQQPINETNDIENFSPSIDEMGPEIYDGEKVHYDEQSIIDDDHLIHLDPKPSFKEISKPRKILFVLLMALTQLLCQAIMSQTVVSSIYIAKDFNISDNPGEISWMTAAFSLTIGTFILISGRFGDLLGYKKIYITSYLLLSVWSILAGISYYSESIEFFDICRAMQGLVFSAAIPNALGLLGHYFPNGPEKNMAFAVFGGVAPGGFVIGALFDALFTQLTNWRWQFYVTAIVAIFTAIASYFIIPNDIGSKPKNIRIEMFDPWGSISGVIGLVLINFALNHGPVVGWNIVYVYVLLIVGIFTMVAFCFFEKKAAYPLVPPLNTKIMFTLACISLGWSSFGVWLFYNFKFAYEILGLTITVAAVQFIPASFAGMLAGLVTGKVLPIIPTSLIMVVSMCCFEGGMLLSGLRPEGQIYWAQKFPSMIICSFGMDTSFPSGIMILSNALPKRHQGAAASLVNTAVNYSISVGLGIAGTVEYYETAKGHSPFEVIRYAFYTGMGLSGLGVCLSLVFALYEQNLIRKSRKIGNKV